jgi:hypothetical protein
VLSLFGSGQSKEMTAEGPLQQDLGGVTKLPAALWLLASFMNHACLRECKQTIKIFLIEK